MKKAIKKIAAVAMAFTLLGTGTAVTKTISPKSDNTITAHAGVPPQYCNHQCGTKDVLLRIVKGKAIWQYEYAVCCKNCNTKFYVYWEC